MMNRLSPRFLSVSVLTAACVCAATGCSVVAEDDDLEDEKVATTLAALDTASDSDETEELENSSDPAAAAQAFANAKSKGCRTRTIDPVQPNVVLIELADCRGRFNGRSVSGRIVVTFSANADGSLHAEKVSESLLMDGRPFSRRVSEDIRIADSKRFVTRHAEHKGTNRKGVSVVKTSDSVIEGNRETHCRIENGTGRAVFGNGRTMETVLSNLQVCAAPDGASYCPTGQIRHESESGDKRVIKTFDGTAVARVEVQRRKGTEQRTWELACVTRPSPN